MTKTTLTKTDIQLFANKLMATVDLADAARQIVERFRSGRVTASASVGSSNGHAKRSRRRGLSPDTVFAALKKSKGGVSVGTLAHSVGADKGRVAAALKKLRDDKKAKMTGEKRLARWFAA